MSNICDPFQPAWWESNASRCREGEGAFDKDLAPLTKIRQEIGKALLKPNAKKVMPSLLRKLNDNAKPVTDTYTRNRASCEQSNDVVACGYARAHDGFVKLFGPINEISRQKNTPTRIPLAPLKSGYIVARAETRVDGETGPPNQEVLFDTAVSKTMFSESYFVENRSNFSSSHNVATTVPGSVMAMQFYTADNLGFSFAGTIFSPSPCAAGSIVDLLGGSDAGHRLVAFVGLDFLLSTPFEVNYTRSEMFLHQQVERRLASGNWEAIPQKGSSHNRVGEKCRSENSKTPL